MQLEEAFKNKNNSEKKYDPKVDLLYDNINKEEDTKDGNT